MENTNHDECNGKNWFSVRPGTMGLCGLAIKLFRLENVNSGDWLTPVDIFCSEEDAKAFVELADKESNGKLVHNYRLKK